MSNFCPNCGAKIREDAKFCGSCGQKISDDSSPKIELKKSSPVQLDAPTPEDTSPKIELKKSSPAQLDAPPTSPPQENYSPPEDTTPHYKEDVTFQEMFFTSEGRLNRWRYFKRTLAVNLINLLVLLIIFSVCSTPSGDITQTGDVLTTIVAVIVLIPKFFLDIRRMKDSAKFNDESTIKLFAGVFAAIWLAFIFDSSDWEPLSPMPPLLKLLSLISLVMWAIIQFPAGTVGPNKYGADPLENKRR